MPWSHLGIWLYWRIGFLKCNLIFFFSKQDQAVLHHQSEPSSFEKNKPMGFALKEKKSIKSIVVCSRDHSQDYQDITVMPEMLQVLWTTGYKTYQILGLVNSCLCQPLKLKYLSSNIFWVWVTMVKRLRNTSNWEPFGLGNHMGTERFSNPSSLQTDWR